MKLFLVVVALLMFGTPVVSGLHKGHCPTSPPNPKLVGGWSKLTLPDATAVTAATAAGQAFLKMKSANAALGCLAATKPRLSGTPKVTSGCRQVVAGLNVEVYFTIKYKCSPGKTRRSKKLHAEIYLPLKGDPSVTYVEAV